MKEERRESFGTTGLLHILTVVFKLWPLAIQVRERERETLGLHKAEERDTFFLLKAQKYQRYQQQLCLTAKQTRVRSTFISPPPPSYLFCCFRFLISFSQQLLLLQSDSHGSQLINFHIFPLKFSK